MPPDALLGLGGFEQYQSQTDNSDEVIYGITKFFRLALGCNPNILELLFAPIEKWQVIRSEWGRIWTMRHLFLSQRVRQTFSGYALSQLKRMQRHYRWLSNPPKEPPPETQECAETREWKNYRTWVENRNPARAKLEANYGYDTKHAANLVRMVIQGYALLRDNTFNPVLEEGALDTVMSVLNGKWDYADVVDYAEQHSAAIQKMKTTLPKEPDKDTLEALLIKINRESLMWDAVE